MCLFKLVAQGWEGNEVVWPRENLVNTGQANAKRVCWLEIICVSVICENEMHGVFSVSQQSSLSIWETV